jgi:hypothetical protein
MKINNKYDMPWSYVQEMQLASDKKSLVANEKRDSNQPASSFLQHNRIGCFYIIIQ